MKISRRAQNCLYPMPLVIVGANVHGKPNYITIAHVGIMDFYSVSVSMGKKYYTNAGIKENKTFSVNIPSVEMVKEAEYCGLTSGKAADKANLFDNFYGKLQTAPMIKECPINMECKLIQTVAFPNHNVFVGEIAETYYDDQYVTNGVVDPFKVQPILFTMNDTGYWKLGERFAKAWNVENTLKNW
jgi:flavin reductase (DIM6/NTAB) family NADH-FMN oxidoreductase RutF